MIAPRSSRLVTALFFLFQAVALGASIGAVAISPGSTPAGITATVTVTAVITDPSIIASTVILQKLDPQGRILATIGDMKDDGKAGDTTANDGTYTIRFSIYDEKPGAQTYRVSAGVLGSLVRTFSANLPFNITGAFATGVTISQPANLTFVNTSPITVSGTTGDPTATVQVNGIAAAKSGNTFQTTVPLQEGNNTITAVAANSNSTTSSASIQVTLDTTPPHVSIDSPLDGSHTTEPNVTVTGLINDIVVGTVNSLQATVRVNGAPAQVTNRTYSLASVPLQLGLNTIQVVGRDQTGNSATLSAKVTRDAITQPFIKLLSGNNQSGAVGVQLPLPLVAQVLNGSTPLPNVPVLFKITENDGFLQPGTNKPQLISVPTNAQGQAQAFLTLGNRAGAGNNTVEAYAVGYQGIAQFVASGTPKQASKINVDSGNNQFGTVNQALALPFVGVVTDVGNNRLPNVPVTFTVKQGGGTMNGQSAYQTTSDSDGRVLAVLTLGSQPGQDGNVVDASFAGNTGLPATFTATGKIPGNASLTTVSGVVQDNSNNPIPGVTMRLFQTNQGSNNNQPMQVGASVLTGNGTFKMVSAPVGFFKLMADGGTATQGGKIYPTLEYDLITVAGQDNGVGMPIYLPALDPLAKVCVDATTGGVLKVSSSPGFSLTILPGAATFPGGSKTGCVSVTPVNPDKVPMVPGFGQQPRYVVTIQPVGTMFNPPAAITIPNMDGLAPHAKTEMYSYDHDLAAFVAIGAGTVSGDGSIIASDPGVGVLKAGWHCGGNPGVPGSGQPVSVKITTTPPVVIAKDGTATITSVGAPVESPPGTYSWKSSDPSIAAIQGSSTSANVVVKGVATGKATLTVRFTCSSVDSNGVHPFAEATIDVSVILVTLSEVGWSGGNHAMKKTGNDTWTNDKFGDEGDTAIVNPIWIDTNTDGTPETDDPVAYSKGAKPTLTQIKLKISPTAPKAIAAKLKVESVSGALKFAPADISLSGDSITVATLTTTDTVGAKVDNSNYELHWSISYDGGAKYQEFAVSTHRVFTTFDAPAGYYANPGITARRIDRAATIAKGQDAPVTIAQKMSQAVRTDIGFDLNKYVADTTGNHWALVDGAVSCDCISLSMLVIKHLRMIGISAKEGRAFPTGGNPPGDTDAGASETDVIGGVPAILGFFAAGGFNRFEGFFEISDAGVRKAFTVDPVQGPIPETSAAVSGDKLQYNVIKTSLTLIQGGGGNNGKQFWFKQSDEATILNPGSPIPFP